LGQVSESHNCESKTGEICVRTKFLTKIGMVELLLLILAISIVDTAYGANENLETSEEICIAAFVTNSALSGRLLIKNVIFSFNHTIELPLNTSLPAFDDHFQNAKYAVVLGERFWISLAVSYKSLDVNLAENYTDSICEEFRKAFDLNLNIIGKTHTVNNNTDTIDVFRKLGYFPREVEPILELVKYKPEDGFGKLITRDFLSLYLPGDLNTGLIYLEYFVSRENPQRTFSWEFTLGLTHGESFKNGDYIDVNLNEMLAHSGPIEPSARKSSIFIVDNDGNVLREYHLSGPIDNVIERIKINEGGSDFDSRIILVGIVVFAMVSAIVCLLFKKKRKTANHSNRLASVSRTRR